MPRETEKLTAYRFNICSDAVVEETRFYSRELREQGGYGIIQCRFSVLSFEFVKQLASNLPIEPEQVTKGFRGTFRQTRKRTAQLAERGSGTAAKGFKADDDMAAQFVLCAELIRFEAHRNVARGAGAYSEVTGGAGMLKAESPQAVSQEGLNGGVGTVLAAVLAHTTFVMLARIRVMFALGNGLALKALTEMRGDCIIGTFGQNSRTIPTVKPTTSIIVTVLTLLVKKAELELQRISVV
ncbi:uncharacterized protein BcabD6B2_21440 [Babesia caballi]|uniref:Uncharacterized protein n=1 Tax=Babesia caballi TaxID=5871 RepID=A0AAV4LRU4_BABCB|nr:hypothetical protein BcabD6B2_21440 [Babesia caballi]